MTLSELMRVDLGELSDGEIDTIVAGLVSATIAVERLGDTYVLMARRLHADVARFHEERLRRRQR